MSNPEDSLAEPTPEKIDYNRKAQEAILAFEIACLNFENQSITENREFVNLFNDLTETLQTLASAHSGPDASIWYNYYLTQTFGILSESFPELAEDFNTSYDELVYLATNLSNQELQNSWKTKIAEIMG